MLYFKHCCYSPCSFQWKTVLVCGESLMLITLDYIFVNSQKIRIDLHQRDTASASPHSQSKILPNTVHSYNHHKRTQYHLDHISLISYIIRGIDLCASKCYPYVPLIVTTIRLPSKCFFCKVAPQYEQLVLPLGETVLTT